MGRDSMSSKRRVLCLPCGDLYWRSVLLSKGAYVAKVFRTFLVSYCIFAVRFKADISSWFGS